MPSTLKALLIAALILGGAEGIAYWWMHPAASGLDEPVLVYRPRGAERTEDRGQRTEDRGQRTEDRGQRTEDRGRKFRGQRTEDRSQLKSRATKPLYAKPTASSSESPISAFQNFSFQLLPEIVANSIPSLHCSTGTAARIDTDDGVTIHLAFFEWDLADSTNVLEAYKHLPEECMGSIGMTFVENLPPRTYQVGRSQEEGNSSTDHRSLIIDHSLIFTHTVFNDPAGVRVHAFKSVWVSGLNNLIGDGFAGGGNQARQIRWKAALKRFHPAYARVAQGAVRGIANPDLAWEAFEKAMLGDLRMEKR